MRKGEICYGETNCMDGLGPLAKIKDQWPPPIDETCGRCRLKDTKPQPVPAHLAEWVDFLETRAARYRLGVVANEESFNAFELAAIDGKADAKAKFEGWEDARRRREGANDGAPGAGQSSIPKALGRPMQRLN